MFGNPNWIVGLQNYLFLTFISFYKETKNILPIFTNLKYLTSNFTVSHLSKSQFFQQLFLQYLNKLKQNFGLNFIIFFMLEAVSLLECTYFMIFFNMICSSNNWPIYHLSHDQKSLKFIIFWHKTFFYFNSIISDSEAWMCSFYHQPTIIHPKAVMFVVLINLKHVKMFSFVPQPFEQHPLSWPYFQLYSLKLKLKLKSWLIWGQSRVHGYECN